MRLSARFGNAPFQNRQVSPSSPRFGTLQVQLEEQDWIKAITAISQHNDRVETLYGFFCIHASKNIPSVKVNHEVYGDFKPSASKIFNAFFDMESDDKNPQRRDKKEKDLMRHLQRVLPDIKIRWLSSEELKLTKLIQKENDFQSFKKMLLLKMGTGGLSSTELKKLTHTEKMSFLETSFSSSEMRRLSSAKWKTRAKDWVRLLKTLLSEIKRRCFLSTTPKKRADLLSRLKALLPGIEWRWFLPVPDLDNGLSQAARCYRHAVRTFDKSRSSGQAQ